MRKCTGGNTHEWGFDAIFEVKRPNCGAQVEFFQDEITRNCPACNQKVKTTRKDLGCALWCSASSDYNRNICPKFRRSKARRLGRKI